MRTTLLILLLLSLLESAIAGRAGTIRGVVLDQEGHSVPGAKVSYENLDDHRVKGSLVPFVETDSEGRFTFDNLDWGRYAIYPMKEADGYANMRFAIYSQGRYDVAVLSPEHPFVSITVKLGPKAAILHGKLLNAVNGAPLHGRMELRVKDHPERFFATSIEPEYHILFPADTDVDVTFDVKGFSPYSTQLRLRSGEDFVLDAKLTPLRDTP